jgi:hypothetical protein
MFDLRVDPLLLNDEKAFQNHEVEVAVDEKVDNFYLHIKQKNEKILIIYSKFICSNSSLKFHSS